MGILAETEAAIGYTPVHVHVDNAEDMRAVKTQEVEAAHLTTLGFILPPVGAVSPQSDYNQNVPTQILQLDPLRKRAIVSINNTVIATVSQCYLCSSQAQAQSLQFGSSQTPDAGALVTAPFTFEVDSTAPMWAVLANGGITVGVIQERRDS
jgi:hypothetical protein